MPAPQEEKVRGKRGGKGKLSKRSTDRGEACATSREKGAEKGGC